MKKNIYLASPFFNEKQLMIEKKVNELLELNPTVGLVFEPRLHQDTNEFASPAWRNNTYMSDINQIRLCDVVVAVLDFASIDNEVIPDPGTVWEMGYAYALNKPFIVVSYDKVEKLNLMIERSYTKLFNGKEELEQLKELDFNILMPDQDRPLDMV